MIFTEVIQSLGFGEQVTLAAVLVIAVLYLFRAKKYSKVVVGAIGTVWLGMVSITLAAAIAIYLGWVDPSPSAFISDVLTGITTVIEFILDTVVEWLPEI